MIKVAFWFDRPEQYTGGLNYLKNLLYAISLCNEGRIQPYVFFGRRINPTTAREFASLATVIHTPVLDRGTLPWLAQKLLYRLFGAQWLVTRHMRRHGIDVVSHAEHVHGRRLPFRLISWLPDFQYLHLPELFPGLSVERESRRIRRMVAHSDVVLLSSRAALEDFKRIALPDSLKRVRVLPFVSQPNSAGSTAPDDQVRNRMQMQFGFHGPFFFLPNQFWQHKNHRVVFEAVRLLAQRGQRILLVCTGNLRDYRRRDDGYVRELREFLVRHELQESIRILGLIDYRDVLLLMHCSLAVLNPSRFEGWSSTVEEARSMGKRLVLSRIPVHLEQNPPLAHYFEPDDSRALAAILEQLWNSPREEQPDSLAAARANLHRRTLVFGRGYLDLVAEVVAERGSPAPV